MHVDGFSFGSICIDDATYEHDVIIDRGKVREREKKSFEAPERVLIFRRTYSCSKAKAIFSETIVYLPTKRTFASPDDPI
jgi:hypothetical protein